MADAALKGRTSTVNPKSFRGTWTVDAATTAAGTAALLCVSGGTQWVVVATNLCVDVTTNCRGISGVLTGTGFALSLASAFAAEVTYDEL